MTLSADGTPLPITVMIMTRNEAANIERCIKSVIGFEKIIVVDSFSSDGTAKIAEKAGAKIMPFEWNRKYPKKRQWCLDNIPVRTPWIMFLDADETVTSSLRSEISKLVKKKRTADAYFIKSLNVWNDKLLQHGRLNNKIVLFKKGAIFFPDMKDEEEFNMGEIEGHYQPFVRGKTGSLAKPLIHYGPNNRDEWTEKHRRYARWTAWMILHGKADSLSDTETGFRKALKTVFYMMPFKCLIAFVDSYFLKLGFLDGAGGFGYAFARARYYHMVAAEIRALRRGENV